MKTRFDTEAKGDSKNGLIPLKWSVLGQKDPILPVVYSNHGKPTRQIFLTLSSLSDHFVVLITFLRRLFTN